MLEKLYLAESYHSCCRSLTVTYLAESYHCSLALVYYCSLTLVYLAESYHSSLTLVYLAESYHSSLTLVYLAESYHSSLALLQWCIWQNSRWQFSSIVMTAGGGEQVCWQQIEENRGYLVPPWWQQGEVKQTPGSDTSWNMSRFVRSNLHLNSTIYHNDQFLLLDTTESQCVH